jgi:hypothetical protein
MLERKRERIMAVKYYNVTEMCCDMPGCVNRPRFDTTLQIKNVRDWAQKEKDWHFADGKDICPTCWKKLESQDA